MYRRMNEKHNLDLSQTAAHIKEHGCSVVMIEGTDYLPSFGYSVGLWETYKHPEIICFGLPHKTLHPIINTVADLIKNGQAFTANVQYQNIFANSVAEFLEVDNRNIGDYFEVAIQYYHSKTFPVLQLIWPDRNNKFPWEIDFEEIFKFKQPLLDRNAEFKFKEERNLGIFTTRQWLEKKEPIVRVIHDHDGDWQFLTENFSDEGILVNLESMIKSDKTLNQVFGLEYGEAAERKEIGGNWSITTFEEEEE